MRGGMRSAVARGGTEIEIGIETGWIETGIETEIEIVIVIEIVIATETETETEIAIGMTGKPTTPRSRLIQSL